MKSKMSERFHPGEMIREELKARGWDRKILSDKSGLSEEWIAELLAEKRGITPISARALSQAFGISMQFFLNMQKAFEGEKPDEK